MAKTFGWLILAAVAVTLTINSVYVLIFPHTWLRLPDWFPTAGTSLRERYAGERELIGIRMIGAHGANGLES
jgi:hypothetical protein